MVNGLGVLGWGVGGIEAEAAMLGQPVTMLIPQVIGFKLTGALPAGTTATDLVLTVTEILRKKGVVDKFVEFFGDGLKGLPLADRATIANMSPEFGSTCAIFPIDEETLRYLELTGRPAEQIALVEAYAKAQGLWRIDGAKAADYTDVVELDLGSVEPALAGPKRPQDRVPLRSAKSVFRTSLKKMADERSQKEPQRHRQGGGQAAPAAASRSRTGRCSSPPSRAVPIPRIPRCWSPPACWRARRERRAFKSKPWVKTSLAPGSRVVTDYLTKAGLLADLEALGFYTVGYGCTTCIGNSGPAQARDLRGRQSGRRGRLLRAVRKPEFRGARASGNQDELPRLPAARRGVCAGGKPEHRHHHRASGDGQGRQARPSQGHLAERGGSRSRQSRHRWTRPCSSRATPTCSAGTRTGAPSRRRRGKIYAWDGKSTYVKNPPYFDGMTMTPAEVGDIKGARVLAVLGDSVTTDHISPAGNISKSSPAAKYLMEQGVKAADFNSYGARRGNHEVMMRGTFANIRLRNLLLPGTEGGVTLHIPSGETLSIFDAAMKYKKDVDAARDSRGQGVRHRQLARLGRQRHHAARRQSGDRRELRAHPSLESHRNGRAAAAIQGRRERAES